MDIYVAAQRCDASVGVLVGNVTIQYSASGPINVVYSVARGYTFISTHLYIGKDMFPEDSPEPLFPDQFPLSPKSPEYQGGNLYIIKPTVLSPVYAIGNFEVCW